MSWVDAGHKPPGRGLPPRALSEVPVPSVLADAQHSDRYYIGLIGGLSRDRAPDDPELVRARQALKALRLRQHVEKVLDGEPKLTVEQIDGIIDLLRTGA